MTTQIRQQNGISILEPSGKIVGHSVLELREVILPQIAAADTPRILINFENVSMIDSSGLGYPDGSTGCGDSQGLVGWVRSMSGKTSRTWLC